MLFIDFPELSYSTIPEFRQEAITPKMCSTLIHSMGIGNATYCRQCNQKRLKSLILINIPKVLLISASCITTVLVMYKFVHALTKLTPCNVIYLYSKFEI